MQKRGLIIIIYVLVLVIGFYAGSYYNYNKQGQQELDKIQSSFESKGWQLYSAGDYDGAIQEFQSYIKRNKNNFVAYQGLGWGYYKKQDYENSIENFNKAKEINPSFYDAYSGLGWSYYALNDYEKAANNFNKASELRQDILVIYNGLGRSYYKLRKSEEAKNVFNKALAINPNLVFPYVGLFLISYENGNNVEAGLHLDKIIPFRYDLGLQADESYKAFGDCMAKLNLQDEELQRLAHQCGELL